MRYFALIDGERRGPYELAELSQAGVRPDTYVWCKGMADWEKAEDVADICRHFRQTIFDRMHPSPAPPPASPDTMQPPQSAEGYENVPLRFRRMVRDSGEAPPEFRKEDRDVNRPPAPTLMPAIFLMFFCFPPTGLVAVYYSFKARRFWVESLKSESKGQSPLYTDEERTSLRTSARDYDRKAKMWVGITFFLGMIFYAFLGHKFT